MPEGIVYLVGAGPGNPELLTVRAKELIESAQALVYDYLVHPAFMHLVPRDCEMICVGKRKGFHSKPQSEIQAILLRKAKEGKRVVRLKGGDPFLFGRGGEEAKALQEAGIEFEVVPGITAAMGASAYSGIPLTDRNTNATLVFVTGHEDPQKMDTTVDWASLPKKNSMICVYMGVSNLEPMARRLIEGGFPRDTPVACVEWATLGHQRICRGKLDTISEVSKAFGLKAPAIIMVGENAAMSEELSWFEKKPLQGRRFVVTRSRGQASELSAKLERLGAEVIGLPLISITRNIDPQTKEDVFKEIASYDWLVFSSPNGVRFFFEAFFETFEDIRSLGFLRIAAVGKSTAKEIKKYYVTTDLIPDEANAESLADALIATDSMDSAKILVVAGNLGRDVLIDKLEEARAIVDRFEVYKTEQTDLSEQPAAKQFREQGADGILFTSSSGVRSFVEQAKHLQLGDGALRPKTISIGKITSAAMKEMGLPVDLQAKEASLDSLVEAVVKRFGK
ncbi:uroporphyrinogen-III C-methyltransferase [Pelagicoccus sp. SDUM812003]|uniref:uroporphyrinogen-III C-methyltransferase n=1 Tax=Pelagicoccus sp. SDUM812003 TaxID=3041267 RepID=UPI0028106371|nr:uroporphyrinogen-III C-methyltransferase [Pelagicoccus sp. SDUM812003]MDQ8202863.1 uroporphyrinogen-III C-methyltransferase [Pelagicoccus sp. SDUM812003]